MARLFWEIFLAAFLIVWALLQISNFAFEGQRIVLGLLAVAAAVCLLLRK